MSDFIHGLRNNDSLSTLFTRLAADFARQNGYDVNEQDIARMVENQPQPRPLPPGGGDMTTQALGEEDRPNIHPVKPGNPPPSDDGPPRITTMALGEEDKPQPQPQPQPGRVTSAAICAIGEEDAPRATTLAVGEEDLNRRKKTTLAVGEEEKGRVTTAAVGEEDPNRGKKTTKALGEEDKKRRPAGPQP